VGRGLNGVEEGFERSPPAKVLAPLLLLYATLYRGAPYKKIWCPLPISWPPH